MTTTAAEEKNTRCRLINYAISRHASPRTWPANVLPRPRPPIATPFRDVTWTAVFVLRRLLLKTEGASQESHQSVCVVSRNKNVFSWRRKVVVDRSNFSCVGSVFHARGAAIQSKPCRRFVDVSAARRGRQTIRSTQCRSSRYIDN